MENNNNTSNAPNETDPFIIAAMEILLLIIITQTLIYNNTAPDIGINSSGITAIEARKNIYSSAFNKNAQTPKTNENDITPQKDSLPTPDYSW